MKINIVEISKNKEFDLEIVFVKDIKDVESEDGGDSEILSKLDFKATDAWACIRLYRELETLKENNDYELAVSVITDLGVEGIVEKCSHEEVQKAAAEAQPRMSFIMKELVEQF
jgi:hypothetical protein